MKATKKLIIRCNKGKGCLKDINIEVGGLMRITLDRTSSLYKAVYLNNFALADL